MPNLEMAPTILHEGIHAEIFKYVDEHHSGEIDPSDRKRLWQLYSFYGAQNGKDVGTTEAQHRYMTEKFVEPIAQALRQLDSNKYDLSFYTSFAWGGLESYGLSGFYVDGVKRTLDDSEFKEKLSTVLKANNFHNVCN